VDETALEGETPVELVKRLAELKASSINHTNSELVLAADTVVCLDGKPIGKPTDKQHCIDMLMGLSGRSHDVVTGVCVLRDQEILSTTVTTLVCMGAISKMVASQYWDSGEPHDKAGGYAIQGYGAVFVTRIEGSYSNVVGLPLYETARLLEQSGLIL
jgi:septum formation protein